MERESSAAAVRQDQMLTMAGKRASNPEVASITPETEEEKLKEQKLKEPKVKEASVEGEPKEKPVEKSVGRIIHAWEADLNAAVRIKIDITAQGPTEGTKSTDGSGGRVVEGSPVEELNKLKAPMEKQGVQRIVDAWEPEALAAQKTREPIVRAQNSTNTRFDPMRCIDASSGGRTNNKNNIRKTQLDSMQQSAQGGDDIDNKNFRGTL
ncbi:hypothetical protein HK102_000519 [Quaeritorhiza haematococci]|nr:hypothetical protein HK102_000519 [Quaeritorhiza haematococci]